MSFPFPSHYHHLQNSGPCNSFYCLGHLKNVYDDDDDDDDDVGRPSVGGRPGARALCPPLKSGPVMGYDTQGCRGDGISIPIPTADLMTPHVLPVQV